MKTWLTLVVLSLGLLVSQSCAVTTAENRWVFSCSDGFVFAVTYQTDNDEAIFEDGLDRIRLKQLRSGSGARYGDGDIEFWNKGTNARIIRNDQTLHENCEGVRES